MPAATPPGSNQRPFFLPSSADLLRPQDVFSQGILMKALLLPLARHQTGPALVVFDLVPAPGAPADLGLDALPHPTCPIAPG